MSLQIIILYEHVRATSLVPSIIFTDHVSQVSEHLMSEFSVTGCSMLNCNSYISFQCIYHLLYNFVRWPILICPQLIYTGLDLFMRH